MQTLLRPLPFRFGHKHVQRIFIKRNVVEKEKDWKMLFDLFESKNAPQFIPTASNSEKISHQIENFEIDVDKTEKHKDIANRKYQHNWHTISPLPTIQVKEQGSSMIQKLIKKSQDNINLAQEQSDVNSPVQEAICGVKKRTQRARLLEKEKGKRDHKTNTGLTQEEIHLLYAPIQTTRKMVSDLKKDKENPKPMVKEKFAKVLNIKKENRKVKLDKKAKKAKKAVIKEKRTKIEKEEQASAARHLEEIERKYESFTHVFKAELSKKGTISSNALREMAEAGLSWNAEMLSTLCIPFFANDTLDKIIDIYKDDPVSVESAVFTKMYIALPYSDRPFALDDTVPSANNIEIFIRASIVEYEIMGNTQSRNKDRRGVILIREILNGLKLAFENHMNINPRVLGLLFDLMKKYELVYPMVRALEIATLAINTEPMHQNLSRFAFFVIHYLCDLHRFNDVLQVSRVISRLNLGMESTLLDLITKQFVHLGHIKEASETCEQMALFGYPPDPKTLGLIAESQPTQTSEHFAKEIINTISDTTS